MSNLRQEKLAHASKNDGHLWDEAISLARLKIEKAEQRIAKLRSAIQTFEELRDKGEPFFDEGVAKELSEAAA